MCSSPGFLLTPTQQNPCISPKVIHHNPPSRKHSNNVTVAALFEEENRKHLHRFHKAHLCRGTIAAEQ
ncbi:hypothetical protein SKAU_G00340180 [Synaphobranchus kaupii]|uniref:Uncharacterized protein n=1 Tax=Synaphobranchus kaupii TaxID=118154 RepID=A0A9Q1EMW2_SYNKA|nr:hypothetical protein SKAU_G00340180 [Synaphobranchus kaupii]